ncbi:MULTISPECIES: biliverdin-producing heme oxygenase [Aeromonas]|jgi:heme oxygenase|uniref:Biliverdin-producing heme oxygenase n=3 Tax=Aeromonas TaxID=642 RepID=A0A3G9IM04_AERCA|nr:MULTISPECIES: biliverdin-producing heme oxygenase [Aeromonas]MBL0588178.1 biliverdin-producing heme oxygenase [Aeromonas caviae]MCJ7978462.1 biliverdin-producing heme oxygenase [Aeromonas veronii]MCK2073065.1 biliverdin-producing heme oxygenase [Aeromonas caviae]MCR3931181.1 biliverdin-producing heme oxygenase [Aeromonas caviae]MDH0307760.1 biliverdin-producing heme oxygenase [Aeromonas caviae]
MSNNLEQFRQGLKKAHADLEMEPPFRAVSGHTVTMADVKNFLSILHRFYQAADNHIIHSPFAIDGLYQRRADLLAEDIKNIGGEPVFTGACDVAMPAIDSEAQWLGVVYTIEGSAAGGRYLLRHLRHQLQENLGACTSFFTTISASYETHWPKVIAAFNEKVNTDSDVEHAISAGVSVFDDLVLISKRLPV